MRTRAPTRTVRTLLALVALASLVACGDAPPDYTGDWNISGTWDLTGPFGDDRSVGEVMSELVITEAVSLSPVPGFLEDEATEVLNDTVGQLAAAEIDSNAPPELQAGGVIYEVLNTVLASIDVDSTVTIESGGLFDDLAASEQINTFGFTYQNTPTTLEASDLFAGAGVVIGATWEGDNESDELFVVEPHSFSVQYGELIRQIALEVTDQTGLDQARDAMIAATDCDAVALAMLDGETGIGIDVTDEVSLELDQNDLSSACTALTGQLSGRVLGLLEVDTSVTIGGSVRVHDDDDDAIADRLESLGFTGTIDMLPESVAPRVGVEFTATRR